MRKNTEFVSPSTRPAEECGRLYEFSPTQFHGRMIDTQVMMGENSKSTALGVEGVSRKICGERLMWFRYALSNRTRGRFSAFSPCQRGATVLILENGAAKNAYNRTHLFRGFDGSVSVGLDLLAFPLASAPSVVKNRTRTIQPLQPIQHHPQTEKEKLT